MTEHELKEIIIAELKKVAPECDPAAVDPNENFREALDIDSYSFLQLLVGLSERTSFEIPEADYGKISTLAGMIAYLATHLP